MTRYQVMRRDPDDAESSGCINDRSVGRGGYATLPEAQARARHAAKGEYRSVTITVEADGRVVESVRGVL